MTRARRKRNGARVSGKASRAHGARARRSRSGRIVRAAVLADEGLYFYGRDVEPCDTKDIKTIVDLLTIAERYNCAQLWILPRTSLYDRLCRHNKKLFRVEDARGWEYVPKELRNMTSGWRDNSRHQIIFPGAIDSQWLLETITDPRELLTAIRWLVKTTGVLPSIPTRTARKMVEASITKPPLACNSDLTIFADYKAPELDYLRAPRGDESVRLYVHGIDKNYMFLSACAIHLGDGDYEVRGAGEFDGSLPGIWRANIKGTQGDALSLCRLRGMEDETDAGKFWYYTPTLRLARDLGAEVEIESAFVWRNTRKVLNEFSKKMRAGVLQRDELRGAEQIAAKSLKDAYTHFIGWLARNSGENGQPFWRPDWRSMIVDTAYERLIRNIVKIYDESGLMPFGIHRDSLLYFSDEPDARALLAPLKDDGAIYKRVFTSPARDVVELIGAGYSVSKLAGELKKRWRAKPHGSKRKRTAE